MISVYIDDSLDKYIKEVKFSFEFILNHLGYTWKFLGKEEIPSTNDILLYYAPSVPNDDYLYKLTQKIPVIFIISEKELFIPGVFTGDMLKEKIKEFTLSHKEIDFSVKLPIITSAVYKYPLSISLAEGFGYGKFEFDIIGNIFFHLSDSEYKNVLEKDKKGRISDDCSAFFNYHDIPFINTYLYLLEHFILELNDKRKFPLVQKALWPSNEVFCASLSHDIDRLQKWTIMSVFNALWSNVLLFLTFRWNTLISQTSSIIRYMFTNIEPYWNFEDYLDIEKKFNYRSTWFFGQKSELSDVDYDLHDKDLENEMSEIVHFGSELAYLAPQKTISNEHYKNEFQRFNNILRVSECGVRKPHLCLDYDNHDPLHQEMSFIYDSSRSFVNEIGFFHGVCLPYKIWIKNARPGYFHYEIPVHFSDQMLSLSKGRYIPFDIIKNKVKDLIKITKFYRGQIHFNFSNSNYTDIPFLNKVYTYILDHLKLQDLLLYKATLKQVAHWLRNRDKVEIVETQGFILLNFPDKLDFFTLILHGNYIISKVEGVAAEFKPNDKKIRFINITKNSHAKVFLMPSQKSDAED